MNTFTKIVMVGMMLFLLVLSIATVVLVAGVKGQYFTSIDYSIDATGVYQLRYATTNGTLLYGRAQACAIPGSGTPGPTCSTAWTPRCLLKRQLVALHYWPVTRIGRLTLPQDEFSVYRPPQKTRPPVLLVAHAGCYVEYPPVG